VIFFLPFLDIEVANLLAISSTTWSYFPVYAESDPKMKKIRNTKKCLSIIFIGF